MRRIVFLAVLLVAVTQLAHPQKYVRLRADSLVAEISLRLASFDGNGALLPVGAIYRVRDSLYVVMSTGPQLVGSGTGGSGGTMTSAQTLDSLNDAISKIFTGNWSFASVASFDSGIVVGKSTVTGAYLTLRASNGQNIRLLPASPVSTITYVFSTYATNDTLIGKSYIDGYFGLRPYDSTNVSSGDMFIINAAGALAAIDTAVFNWVHGLGSTAGTIPVWGTGRALTSTYHVLNATGIQLVVPANDPTIEAVRLPVIGSPDIAKIIFSHDGLSGWDTLHIEGPPVMTVDGNVVILDDVTDAMTIRIDSLADELSDVAIWAEDDSLMGYPTDATGLDGVGTDYAMAIYDITNKKWEPSPLSEYTPPTTGADKPIRGNDSGVYAGGDSAVVVIDVTFDTTTVTTGVAKRSVRLAVPIKVTRAVASLVTAGTTTYTAILVKADGTSIFSGVEKIRIPADSVSSWYSTSPTPLTNTIPAMSKLTVDVDTAATGAKGLTLFLYGEKVPQP